MAGVGEKRKRGGFRGNSQTNGVKGTKDIESGSREQVIPNHSDEIVVDEDETSSSGPSEDDDEETSDSDSDAEDDSMDETASDHPVNLTTTVKPSINGLPQSDLRSRLSTFLPQLREANSKLEHDPSPRRIDDVPDGEEHYIEMSLGLGVLKEVKQAEKDGIRTAASDTSESESSSESEQEDAIQTALGSKKSKPTIEEVKAGK